MRSYLAVAGGIAVPEVMGSCSTDLKSGIGGLEGRLLKDGDRLATGKPSRQFSGPQGVKQLLWGIASVRCRGRNTVNSIAPRKKRSGVRHGSSVRKVIAWAIVCRAIVNADNGSRTAVARFAARCRTGALQRSTYCANE